MSDDRDAVHKNSESIWNLKEEVDALKERMAALEEIVRSNTDEREKRCE